MRHYPYGFNRNYAQFKLAPEVQAVVNRLSAGGYNLSFTQQQSLNSKYTLFNTNGGVPTLFFDASISVDTSNSASTKVWNLGSNGATGDGTLTNGNAGNMVESSPYPAFLFSGSDQRIDTSVSTSGTLTYLTFANPSGSGERVMFGSSGTGAPGLYISGTNLFYERVYQAAIATSTGNNFANSTWNMAGLTVQSSNAYQFYVNGNANVNGSSAQSFTTRNLRIGAKITDSDYTGKLQHILVYSSVLTSGQVSAIYNGLKSSVGL